MEDHQNEEDDIVTNQATQNEGNFAASAFFTDLMFRSHHELIDWVENVAVFDLVDDDRSVCLSMLCFRTYIKQLVGI
ncbi:hypothetical protein L6452_25034 [Arctium lappa]|uniref:Uncharacterized protein n=1 Tax=Arctium lappa TaxID=4217 RepID=A0ACB9AC56_ARCLA|nr:hypothetical protein L6452_25034 [Arctium lappa]